MKIIFSNTLNLRIGIALLLSEISIFEHNNKKKAMAHEITMLKLGFTEQYREYCKAQNFTEFQFARVIAEHKERYIVKNPDFELEAEITGNMRFTAKNRADFPAVGDWVAVQIFGDEMAIIHHILPRFSTISRQSVAISGEIQIIATNIDFAFLVQAVDRDFNINRLERYLTICYSSGVSPIILLTKTDLIDNTKLNDIKRSIEKRIKNVPILCISNQNQDGYEDLKSILQEGKTYCLLGSSGVGKSSLTNNLSGNEIMKTAAISQSTHKGRHITSHRELIILSNGSILIDNPGMREVGIHANNAGFETTFEQIMNLADTCKFKDCTHTTETGCAVLHALEDGELEQAAYDNFLKLEKEKSRFEISEAERRKKEKIFGKILKDYKKRDVKNKGK